MVNTKKIENTNKSLRTTLRDIPNNTWEIDFREFKSLISNMEQRALDSNIFTEQDENNLVESLLSIRSADWYISNAKIQKMFGIDYRNPVDAGQLRTFWVPLFLGWLRNYLLWWVSIWGYIDSVNDRTSELLDA